MCWRRSRFFLFLLKYDLPPSPDPRLACRARQEDEKLLQLRGQQGKSFAKIAGEIDGRSYNDVKNRWSQISRQIAALKVTASSSPPSFFFQDTNELTGIWYEFWPKVVCLCLCLNQLPGVLFEIWRAVGAVQPRFEDRLVADQPPDRCSRGDSSSRQIEDTSYYGGP